MDANDIVKYFDKVTNHALPKVSPLQIRNILDRFSTTADGKLNLDGFIQYHLDQATYNPKNVWRVSVISLIVSSPLMYACMHHSLLYCSTSS